MLWRFTRVQSLSTQTAGLLWPVTLCTLCRQCPDAIGQVGCLEVEIEQQQQSLVQQEGKQTKNQEQRVRDEKRLQRTALIIFMLGFIPLQRSSLYTASVGDKQKQHIQKQNVLILIYTRTLFFNLIKANYHLPVNRNFPFCSSMN